MVPRTGRKASPRQAAVKGGLGPAERTLDGCGMRPRQVWIMDEAPGPQAAGLDGVVVLWEGHPGRNDPRTDGACWSGESRAPRRYQQGAEDRDVAIAQALCCLAESSRLERRAGYSRDEACEWREGKIVAVPVASTDEQSGRPGSNWHHQLGRLRFYH
jgi:hypothetical protein